MTAGRRGIRELAIDHVTIDGATTANASAAAVDRAGPADLAAVLEVLGAASLPVNGVETCLSTMLVARLDGRIVGVAAIEPYGRTALLRSVAVDAAIRGSGLGSRLVRAAIRMASDAGIEDLYLLTETAEPFFAGLGWSRIERQRVPDPVRRSVEFAELCPDTAAAMWRRVAVATEDTADS